MQTMEGPSTEKRIDDLNVRMTEGFGRVHREIDGLSERVTEGFKGVDRKLDEVDAWLTDRFQRVEKEMSERFKRVDGDIRELRGDIKDLRSETSARFDAMHRTMMRGFFALGGITVTLFLALAGLQGL
jgi:uncharacterized coiled-coil protein SlyX